MRGFCVPCDEPTPCGCDWFLGTGVPEKNLEKVLDTPVETCKLRVHQPKETKCE